MGHLQEPVVSDKADVDAVEDSGEDAKVGKRHQQGQGVLPDRLQERERYTEIEETDVRLPPQQKTAAQFIQCQCAKPVSHMASR